MKKFKFILTSFLFLFSGLLFFHGGTKTLADSSDKVAGWSWSSTIGWTSFNCINNGSCASADYGVDINATLANKNLSGYAWNSNVGWISFQDPGPTPDAYGFAANCPGGVGVCNGAANCTACLDPDTGKIWGWAKIVSMGNDGWIKLRDEAMVPAYGVYIDLVSASAGEFRGWAWNGNADGSGIGWMSFNCLNDASCAAAPYAVALNGVHLPTVDNLSAPNWSFEDACVVAKGAILMWDMEDEDEPGDFQSAYQVVINTNNTRVAPIRDTGKVSSLAEQYSVNSADLNYATAYYWWVKIWDSMGFASDWYQFYTGAGSSTLTDNIAKNNATSPDPQYTFFTYSNPFPNVSFSRNPFDVKVNEIATFTDTSLAFDGAVMSLCTESLCSWNWSAVGEKTIINPTVSSTGMIFEYGNGSVYLETKEIASGYACTSTANFFVDLLPSWKESQPEN